MRKWLRVLALIVVLGGVLSVPVGMVSIAARRYVASSGSATHRSMPALHWINETPGPLNGFAVTTWDRVIVCNDSKAGGGLVGHIDPRTGKMTRMNPQRPVLAAAVGDDVMYLLHPDSVVAVDGLTLSPIWRTRLPSNSGIEKAGLSLSNDRLLVWSHEQVWMLDLSGQIKWSVAFERGVSGGAAIWKEGVYVVDNAGALHVLNVETGRETSIIRIDAPLIGPVYGAGNLILVRTSGWVKGGPCLLALDDKTGKEAWRFTSSVKGFWFKPCSPVFVEGDVAYFSHEDTLSSINVTTGDNRWTRTLSSKSGLGPPTVVKGVVLVDSNRMLFGLDAADGRELWNCDPLLGMDPELRGHQADCAPSAVGNVLFFPHWRRLNVLTHGSPAQVTAVEFGAQGCSTALFLSAALLGVLMLVIAWLFHRQRSLLAALSLILFGATLWLWYQSFRGEHFAGHRSAGALGPLRNDRCIGVVSRFGSLSFGVRQRVWDDTLRRVVPLSPRGPWCVTQEPLMDPAFPVVTPPRDLGMTHFAWTYKARSSGTPLGEQVDKTLTLPHWLVAVCFAIGPLAWLAGFWRDRRRYPKGCCGNCGYDLRGSASICPECGTGIGAGAKRV